MTQINIQEYEWSDRFMSLEHLSQTEEETAEQTWRLYGGNGFIRMRNLINLFLRLSYFLKEDGIKPDSDDGYFQQRTYFTYLRLPYNYKVIYDLWLKGYYIEACVIFRHVLECFVQLRYFSKHREKVKAHMLATKLKGRISFKTMFEEIAQDSYEFMYSKVLSHIAHGGIGASTFRGEYTSPTEGVINMGCKFNQIFSDYVINQTLSIGYGYLNYADEFFPSLLSNITSDIASKRSLYLKEYKAFIDLPRQSPQQQEAYERIIKPFVEK